MSDDKTPPTEPSVGGWPIDVRIPVAWGDMDAFGHVNNTVYFRWFETARIAYFEAIGLTGAAQVGGRGPILARTTCDYRIPLTYPDRVQACATVTRLGRTSFVMGYKVLSEAHGGAVAASGEGVIVMYDYAAATKVVLDDGLRGAIARLESGL